jgi:hypothetical protein
VTIDHEQLQRADLRLAYVQHPFPAQGHTTDTAHVIASEHATREGSYVALTRARETTHLYAPQPDDTDTDPLTAIADRISRTEPDVPSIHTPLAHEQTITTEPDHSIVHQRATPDNGPPSRHDTPYSLNNTDRDTRADSSTDLFTSRARNIVEPTEEPHRPLPANHRPESIQTPSEQNVSTTGPRQWPNRQRKLRSSETDLQMAHDDSRGWEP